MANNIYVERIDNALRVLRNIEDSSFNMNAWPHCVLGHCASDAWFNSQGLKTRTRTGCLPVFEGEDGILAGVKFFGISNQVAEHLFLTGTPEAGAYQWLASRKKAIGHLEVLRMKKLAESVPGSTIEVTDFVSADA